MFRRLRYFIASVVVVYASLMYFSPQLANFSLAVFLVLMVPVLILRHIFLDKLYRSSITMVPKRFVSGHNTISNEHCTVMYSPDEKIIVMDNVADKTHAKRMFTLTKGKVNINKSWNRVCRIFDEFITLDSLASFYSYDTKIELKTIEAKVKKIEKHEVNIDVSNSGPKFVEMGEITPDSYTKGTEKPREVKENFVELNSIKERPQEKEREEKTQSFVELQDIVSSHKININTATSSELSVLPGINIVIAKKIVEYRDKNGLFTNIDDFINVAEVKDHFIDKIKARVIMEDPKSGNSDDDTYEGRIIDF